MKIGIFNPYNFEKAGGVLDHVMGQATELRKRGHTVVIVTPRPRKFRGDPPEGVIFVGTSARLRAQASSVDVSSLVDAQEIEDMFAQEQFDVFHCHEPAVPFVARQLISLCPCPVVATLHAALPDTVAGKTLGSISPYFRSIYGHVDVFTRVSPAAGEYLGEDIAQAGSVFIPNGINLADYHASKKRDTATVLYVGRLEKRKGVKYLIMAFAELKKHVPEARLDIVGDGHDREKLERLVYELGVQNVTFYGYLDQHEKADRLSRATVYCSPALYGESFGIVLLEAMASGAPVVAGDNAGYRTVLKERGLSSLVNPQDIREFARKLELFITDHAYADLWREWATEYVQQFDYPHIVNQYEQLYRSLARKHH